MAFRRTKSHDFKNSYGSKQKRKSTLGPIIFLFLIIFPIYRIYLRFELADKWSDGGTEEVFKNSKRMCEEYFVSTYSGRVYTTLKAKEGERNPRYIQFENGDEVFTYFTWHHLNKIRPLDSVYKAPNTFTLDVYRGENYEYHITLEKFESQTCD